LARGVTLWPVAHAPVSPLEADEHPSHRGARSLRIDN